MHTKTELDVTADRRLRRISPDSFVGVAAAIAHAIGYPTAAWTRRQLREALGVDRRYYYLIHDRMTHLINNLGTLSTSSLKRVPSGRWVLVDGIDRPHFACRERPARGDATFFWRL